MPPLELMRFGQPKIEHPANGVKHMHAHIPDDPIAVFRERSPPPPVRKPVVRPERSRSGPHFIVEEIRHWLDRWIAIGPHVEIAAHLNMADFSQQAGIDDLFFRIDQMRRALALRPDLHHAFVLAGGSQYGFALEHINADRLLQIDIGTRFQRRDGLQRMPMVGRSDEHDVKLMLLEHLAIVIIRARFVVRLLSLTGNLDRTVQHVLIRIANGNDFRRRHLNQSPQVAGAIPTGANEPHPPGFAVCKIQRVRAQGREGCQRGRSGGGLQEMTTINVERCADVENGFRSTHVVAIQEWI